MSSKSAAAALLCAATVLAIPAAHACSTCKCADPTITLMGSEKAFSGRTRLGFDLLWRGDELGTADTRQETRETRSTLGLAFSPSERLTLALQLPYVDKTLTLPSLEQQSARGWGDADISLRYRLWRSGPLSGRHLLGLRGGVRLPTSESVRDGQGRKLSIDVQPDAGAYATQAGLWYAYHRHPWFLGLTSVYSAYAAGQQQFNPGDVLNISGTGQYAINPNWALLAGIDTRHAQANSYAGVRDVNSGGDLAMGRIGTALRLGQELVLSLSWQTTLYENLDGEQTESDYVRLSFAYDL